MTIPTETPNVSTDEAPKPSNRYALLIVFIVVFIDLLGFGIVLPLLPVFANDYVAKLTGAPATAMGHELDRDPVGGLIVGLLMSSFSLMQFIFAPIWGRISDRIGRRPILLLGLGGSVVFYALFGYALSSAMSNTPLLALTLLFLARTGAGIAGATIATAQAVIADSTPPERRKHGMALIGAAFGIGFTFGPLFAYGSLSLFPQNHAAIGYTAAGLSFVALLLAFRLLPETRRFDTSPPLERGWLRFGLLSRTLANGAIGPVVLTFFLASFGFGAFEATLALLLKEMLGFVERQMLLVFALIGFVLLLTQGLIYRRLAKYVSEATFMAVGIVFMSLGVAGLGAISYLSLPEIAHHHQRLIPEFAALAANPGDLGGVAHLVTQKYIAPAFLLVPLYASLVAAVMGFAFLTPSAQALVSRRTDANKQGEILGVNQSASALARILGPVVGVTLYKSTADHLLPYVFGSVLLLLMLPLIPRIRRG